MLTTEQLAAIRERCDGATPGPWIRSGHNFYGPKHKLSQHPNNRIFLGETVSGSNRRHPYLDGGSGLDDIPGDGFSDAEFIANAREDIPALLEDIEGRIAIGKAAIQAATEIAFDRDRWKARCEAMERAIKLYRFYDHKPLLCFTCTPRNVCDNDISHCHVPSNWQFDEARFAGAGGEADHIGDANEMVEAD